MTAGSPWYLNPEWWQVILIVLGTAIAAWAFLSEREAVCATQRADLLLDSVDLDPPSLQKAVIRLRYKNFGPTRADFVWVTGRLIIEGSEREGAEVRGIPMHSNKVVGAGEFFLVDFPNLQWLLDPDTVGDINRKALTLRFEATVRYQDVFYRRHKQFNAGEFNPDQRVRRFEVEHRQLYDA